ncbi:MAG: hypothetical protein GPOALKHO_001554 [Sodalis sp.]|uniref:hypothetical protein n=1 Tax=Sodalis sp. (in: enterobacteria) TaxID=1898979 RepID=UPI003873769C|nr:MAG: hypothetical protein GPOALKHO_001554 [Sodalis sp.]
MFVSSMRCYFPTPGNGWLIPQRVNASEIALVLQVLRTEIGWPDADDLLTVLYGFVVKDPHPLKLCWVLSLV